MPIDVPMSTYPLTEVEALEVEVRRLVGERQQLRDVGATPTALERNRRSIVRAQLYLARALIRRHLSAPARP
jgi:hypothetical protein